MARRFLQQAHNMEEMPEEKLITEFRSIRGRHTIDAGVLDDASFDDHTHITRLIYAVQAPMRGTHIFHYALIFPGSSTTGPEFILDFMNERLRQKYDVPVRTFTGVL
jgi:hypothetical protein